MVLRELNDEDDWEVGRGIGWEARGSGSEYKAEGEMWVGAGGDYSSREGNAGSVGKGRDGVGREIARGRGKGQGVDGGYSEDGAEGKQGIITKWIEERRRRIRKKGRREKKESIDGGWVGEIEG